MIFQNLKKRVSAGAALKIFCHKPKRLECKMQTLLTRERDGFSKTYFLSRNSPSWIQPVY